MQLRLLVRSRMLGVLSHKPRYIWTALMNDPKNEQMRFLVPIMDPCLEDPQTSHKANGDPRMTVESSTYSVSNGMQ